MRRSILISDHKIYIVSNRLPITLNEAPNGDLQLKHSSGGLVSGLKEIHDTTDSLWIGYLGATPKQKYEAKINSLLEDERLNAVNIPKKLYNNYYNGYSNGVLWPLFHNFLATMSISNEYWDAYVKVNQYFAEHILSIVEDDSFVWIHDYQLMLLPQLLKKANPSLKIAYFHHIPFPSSEIFRAIPARTELITGLLGADYIGFHTYDYARHFLMTVQRLLGIPTKVNEVFFDDRPVKIAAHALGVDYQNLSKLAKNIKLSSQPVESLGEKSSIRFLGIDRLDYTKGLPERLQSFREFLTLYPEYIGKATLVQICVPSRQDIGSYNRIRAQVERLVGQINGEFSRPSYTPIQYIFRSQPLEEIIRLYKSSDVCLVTPLRDGLNLVCKEYVAAKDQLDGCLILSEFAGAASEMGEALQVNPYDITGVAKAMKRALDMPKDERQKRMGALRNRIEQNDNITWAKKFMRSWLTHIEEATLESETFTHMQQQKVLDELSRKKRLFIFLDYDGTLTPIVQRPEMAIPTEKLKRILTDLTQVTKITPTIITGRPRSFCEKYLGDLNVNFIAEHGSFIKEKADNKWHQPLQLPAEEFEKSKPDVIRMLQMYVDSVPGSHIEKKETCIVWHYRESEPNFASEQARILGESLQQMLAKTSLSVYHGKKTLEIRQTLAHKGFGVEYILEKDHWSPEEDALITVGDDVTDEDMHRVHVKNNISIHIGKSNAYSKYHLATPEDLYIFLQLLSASCFEKIDKAPMAVGKPEALKANAPEIGGKF